MFWRITSIIAGLCAATAAQSGGVDRSGQPLGVLYEPGNYIEFSFATATTSISGTQVLVAPPTVTGSSSGDAGTSFGYAGMGLKLEFNDMIDVAVIYDVPYGASIDYPTGTGYFAGGASANLTSDALTTVARYKFGEGFSVHAGLRSQTFNAEASIPFIGAAVGGYSGGTDTDQSFGYLFGAAYERPEIALRVALTYYSAITHDLIATETLGVTTTAPLTVETPQAVNLDFRTGIAEGTLLFGGVRWANWGDFEISPATYLANVGSPLVFFNDDTITYTLGVGRQITDTLSLSVSAVHEPATGGLRLNLSPPDGRTAVGLGLRYQQDAMRIEAGVQHIWLGDATTQVSGAPAGVFEDNTALAFGLKVGFSF